MKTINKATSAGCREDVGELLWKLPCSRLITARVEGKSGGDLQEVTLTSKLRERGGFVYLEVPDEIIEGFMKMIPVRGVEHPEVVSADGYVGAHISVMYPDEFEKIKKKKKRISELGEEFDYTIGKMFATKPDGWDDVREVFFITCGSPQLESLRKKYGLSRLLNGHDFHITVAVVPRNRRSSK